MERRNGTDGMDGWTQSVSIGLSQDISKKLIITAAVE